LLRGKTSGDKFKFEFKLRKIQGKGLTAEAQRGKREDEEDREEQKGTQHKGTEAQRSEGIKVKNRHGGA